MEGDAWDVISAEAKDLVSRMLAPQQSRITAKEVLAHPWLNQA